MGQVRVAIAGVGNCAWSFSQFVALARAQPEARLPGLMCESVGGYRLSDVQVVAAFDVDAAKVGLTLTEAFRAPTITATRHVELDEEWNVPVLPAPVLDGLTGPLSAVVQPVPEAGAASAESVAKALIDRDVDVLVITLPTGASQAVHMFAAAALAAGACVVNATPERLARDPRIAGQFADAGLVLLGDDLRSHLGATTLHTGLLELLASRGLEPITTYQLNVGGNTDFLNLTDPGRSQSKRDSKANALRAAGLSDSDTGAGPTGYVGHLADTKICFINVRARSVLGSEVEIDLKLRVEDSPNAAGVLASAVRAAKLAVDRRRSGVVNEASALLFKSPPAGLPESEARQAFLDFVH